MQDKKHFSFFDKYAIEHKASGSDETVLRDKHTNQFVLMKELNVSTHEEYKSIVQNLEAQKSLRHDHLLSLIDYHSAAEEGQTGITRRIVTFFQYSSHTLLEEIDARIREQRPFEETELWSLICSPTLGLAYLEKENVGHGCVSPIDIYLTAEGLIKIADPSIATASPFEINDGYYYSPEMLAHIANGEPGEVEVFRSDVFSLAMCTLHAALLESCDDCYDYPNAELVLPVLQEKLDRVAQSYSQDLVEFIVVMLSQDPQDRPNFIELEQQLIQALNPAEGSLNESVHPLQLSSQISQNNQQDNTTSIMRKSSLSAHSARASMMPKLPPPYPQMQEEQQDDSNTIEFAPNDKSIDLWLLDTNEESSKAEQEQSYASSINDNSRSMSREAMNQIPHCYASNHNLSSNGLPNVIDTSRISMYYPTSSKQIEQQQPRKISRVHSIINNLPDSYEGSSAGYYNQSEYNKQNAGSVGGMNTMLATVTRKESSFKNNIFNMSNKKSIIIDPQLENNRSILSSVVPKSPYEMIRGGLEPSPSVVMGSLGWNDYYDSRPKEEQLFTDPKLLMLMKNDLEKLKSESRILKSYMN